MTLTKRQQKWFDAGRAHAEKYSNDIFEIQHCMCSDCETLALTDNRSSYRWFMAGVANDMPEYIETTRFGAIPEIGVSRNHASGDFEKGVSTLKGVEGRRAVYEMWYDMNEETEIKIGGWYFGHRGADGEYLLDDCVVVPC